MVAFARGVGKLRLLMSTRSHARSLDTLNAEKLFLSTSMCWLVMALVLIGCSKPGGPGNKVDLKAGLVATWSAEDRTHNAVGASSGALTGGVAVVSSDTGRVFSFDGSGGRVLVPDSSRLNFRANQDFSLVARIKPVRAETPFGVMSIVDKRQVCGISAALGYALHLEDGRLACQLAPRGRWPLKLTDFISPARINAVWQRRKMLVPMTFARFISPGPDLRDGEFHDVALTLERQSPIGGKLYVDGAVVLTFDPTKHATSLANPAPLLIGGHPDSTLHCGFQGQIGDVCLYSRALAAAEIEALVRGVAVEDGHKP
jgi:hypothetical protein